MVARALASQHIQVTTGGNARAGSGFFYEPTIVAGARQEDEIVQREVFGPVVSHHARSAMPTRRCAGPTIRSTGSRPRFGRATSHGPCAWPRSCSTAHLDQYPLRQPCSEMPHGGFKRSGYGKDLSVYALEDYTVLRHVMVKL